MHFNGQQQSKQMVLNENNSNKKQKSKTITNNPCRQTLAKDPKLCLCTFTNNYNNDNIHNNNNNVNRAKTTIKKYDLPKKK